MKTNRK
ncbi:uncharacterized protein FTOL_13882 [Fusarium torulosum]|nr:uncharacterized protein FTOL_13882 [Fusarium torulosum]